MTRERAEISEIAWAPPARAYAARMPWRTLARTLGALAGLMALVLVAPLLWMRFDEGGVPSASEIPAPPAGVTVLGEELRCGSGGCWLELRLRGPVRDSAEGWPDGFGWEHQVCRTVSPIDRRPVCSFLVNLPGPTFLLVVQFDRDAWF